MRRGIWHFAVPEEFGKEQLMKIRVMLTEDYDAVYSLWIRTPGMGLNRVDDSREGIEKYLKRNPTTCFIAEEEGRLIGVILSGHDGRRGYIHHTAVDRTKRKGGIGTALLNAAMDALKAEGIIKVALVVFKKNETGNHFWDEKGFEKRQDLIYRNKSLQDIQRIDT